MAAKNKIEPVIINIFKPQGQNSKVLDKLLKWILSSGKFVLIFVELVVIGCFIYRYQLYSKIDDLNNQIDTQSSLIKAKSNIETQVRLTQFQLTSIKQIKNDNLDYPTLIGKISASTPTTTTLSTLNITKNQDGPFPVLEITGKATSSSEVSAFVKALQGIDNLSDITLTNISADQQTLTFSITGNVKKGGATGG